VSVSDDEPIPIRLAESRESLVASLIALALIAAVFVAHFGGVRPREPRIYLGGGATCARQARRRDRMRSCRRCRFAGAL
jgi:hypothetical protein